MSSAPLVVSLLKSLPPAIDSWKTFSLDTRRPTLDQQSSQASTEKAEAAKRRKTLGDRTKQFKRCVLSTESLSSSLPSEPSAELVSELSSSLSELTKNGRGVIKGYQEEIDKLTQRCRSSDSAFLTLYQGLYGLPDPVSFLTNALNAIREGKEDTDRLTLEKEGLQSKLQSLPSDCQDKETVTELRRELEEYEEEFRHLKNQDITIRKLEARILSMDTPGAPPSDSSNKSKTVSLKSSEREELIQLRKEVREYEVEFRGLKNQDITIRKLESKIAEMQRVQEEETLERIGRAQEELLETEGRRAMESLEREAAMERRLATVQLELRAERAGQEAAQSHLLDSDEYAHQREAAWEAQRQILVDDYERIQREVQEVARERDTMRLKIEVLDKEGRGQTVKDGNIYIRDEDFVAERRAYEAEVTELTLTANSLKHELKCKQESTKETLATLQDLNTNLTNDKIQIHKQLHIAQQLINTAPSLSQYDSMKRELRILKRLEYNVMDSDNNPDTPMTLHTDDQPDDFESVLVNRLKKADADLLKIKREKDDILKASNTQDQTLQKLQKDKDEADRLILSLEKDLNKATSSQPVTTDALTKASHHSIALQTIVDPNAPLASQDSTHITTDDNHSVVTIIMSQRDRLRARCDQMEAERDSFKRELQNQVHLSESFKIDNTKLYEKVRYLQNFNTKQSSRSPNSIDRDRDLDLEALEQRYEASVDPFRQFSRSERNRKLRDMSPLERIVFGAAKLVLANKHMRTALFFYVLTMHFLVFITTWHWAHELGCMEDFGNREEFAHMHGGMPLHEIQDGE